MRTIERLAAVGGCLLFLGVSRVHAQGDIERPDPSPPTVTVSASAQVEVRPDRAVVRLGAVAQAEDASAAQDRVNGIMRRIADALERLDVPEQSIRTEELSLYPVYQNRRPTPNGEADEPHISAYRASSVVSAEVEALERIGAIVDAGIAAGANQLQGVAFELRDDAAGRAEATSLAVRKARAQAEAIAAALGMRIGGVREVVAGGANVRSPRPYNDTRLAAAEVAATPVQPGQIEISGSVTVTYELAALDAQR